MCRLASRFMEVPWMVAKLTLTVLSGGSTSKAEYILSKLRAEAYTGTPTVRGISQDTTRGCASAGRSSPPALTASSADSSARRDDHAS